MIRGIVAGALARPPEARQSKAGNPYILATIREGSGDKARWISAFAFNAEVREAISGMEAGDAIAVAGELDAEVYVPEGGQPRISWSIKADAVLSANSGARKRNATEPEQPREGPDDPIPF
jgi:single-stranded DNA-binding protein